MRFIKCVVKPAILLRRRLEGMVATSSVIFLLTLRCPLNPDTVAPSGGASMGSLRHFFAQNRFSWSVGTHTPLCQASGSPRSIWHSTSPRWPVQPSSPSSFARDPWLCSRASAALRNTTATSRTGFGGGTSGPSMTNLTKGFVAFDLKASSLSLTYVIHHSWWPSWGPSSGLSWSFRYLRPVILINSLWQWMYPNFRYH